MGGNILVQQQMLYNTWLDSWSICRPTFKLLLFSNLKDDTKSVVEPNCLRLVGGVKLEVLTFDFWPNYRYPLFIHKKNIHVAPLICAYCNSPKIAFYILAKRAGSPMD